MNQRVLALTRSVLFVPATRPDLVAKVGRCGADVVVLDLEDTVPPAAKDEARAAVPALAAVLAEQSAGTRLLRVNAPDTPWFGVDMACLAGRDIDGVVVPKVDGPATVDHIDSLAAQAARPGLPVIAGIESARGVSTVEVVAPRVAAVYFGAEDFVADMGGRRTPAHTEVLYARSRVALAARVAEIPALDQVCFDLANEAGFRRDAELGRDLGYAGKMCLNPGQVRWANEVWTPTEAELARAAAAIAAHDEAVARGEGVAFLDGRLIDLPAVRLARAVLAAGATPTEQQGA
jgi:citrate lyase subunit beta/citryl-CoA lyase